MNKPERERALVVAESRLRGLILDVVREVQGDAAVERHARYEGDQFPEPAPTPLAGLWAADHLAQRSRIEVVTNARRAREAGHSWDEIARTLDMEPEGGRTVAETTYERFAGSPASWSLHGPSFAWRCPACGQLIGDRGPYESHPEDNQPGHANGCARLRDEIDRWRTSWDDIPEGREEA